MKAKKSKPAKKNAARKPEYTRLTCEDVAEIVARATEYLVNDTDLANHITDTFEVEEYEEADGTFFVQYDAKTWRDAAAFTAALIGQAFALGRYAEPSAKLEDGLEGDDKRRLVSVFIAAADYMTDDGHAVA